MNGVIRTALKRFWNSPVPGWIFIAWSWITTLVQAAFVLFAGGSTNVLVWCLACSVFTTVLAAIGISKKGRTSGRRHRSPLRYFRTIRAYVRNPLYRPHYPLYKRLLWAHRHYKRASWY